MKIKVQTSKGYTQGHTYMYEYEGTSVTSVSEVEGDSSVKLSALVELAVKPDCIHQLRLKNVRVNGAVSTYCHLSLFLYHFNDLIIIIIYNIYLHLTFSFRLSMSVIKIILFF